MFNRRRAQAALEAGVDAGETLSSGGSHKWQKHIITCPFCGCHCDCGCGCGLCWPSRWGNPMNYRRGDRRCQQLFCQHSVSFLRGVPGDGHVLLFNNGR